MESTDPRSPASEVVFPPPFPEKVGGKGKSLVHPVFPGKSPRILLNSHGRVRPYRDRESPKESRSHGCGR